MGVVMNSTQHRLRFDMLPKLTGLSRSDTLKIIYGWIHQDHISFKEFAWLFDQISTSKNSDLPLSWQEEWNDPANDVWDTI